ncbi:MAG: membrane-bound lytic murein transglycosylase MltF [Gammaproteobacteria bacterium]|nr:membrane-bound lytic murein transglycosylase MltF [Gammaproteobacteria bacterium]
MDGKRFTIIRTIAWGLAVALVAGCSSRHPAKPQIARIPAHHTLVVLVRSGPTTYYEGPNGPAGIEYDMARDFADYLGARLDIKVVGRQASLIKDLLAGKGDLAAGLTVNSARRQFVRFGPAYQRIREELVYRRGTTPPNALTDLGGHPIEVVGHSTAALELARFAKSIKGLSWADAPRLQTDELLFLVWQGLLPFTIAGSNVVSVNQKYYPALQVAFPVGGPRELAWAFPKNRDNRIYKAAFGFFRELNRSGQLADLIARYYGVTPFNYVHISTYLQRVRSTLPVYEPLFRSAGARYGVPWRLLAAVAYQESLWEPDAESPTGVEGLMMLTTDTCLSLGVTDRLNPRQSINGGARYLRSLINQLPPTIPEPDRTWMALAAYNIGINHVEDARMLTREQGANPDNWEDVEQRLPLLEDPWWYGKTQYGYAAGYTAVQYVNRIRVYYRILRHLHSMTTRSILIDLSHVPTI